MQYKVSIIRNEWTTGRPKKGIVWDFVKYAYLPDDQQRLEEVTVPAQEIVPHMGDH